MSDDANTTPPEDAEPQEDKSLLEKVRLRLIATTIGLAILAVIIAVGIVLGGLFFNVILPAGDIAEYFPEAEGYNQTNVLVDAATTAITWVAELKGFDGIATNIQNFDEYLTCYREEGAFDTRIYASNFGLTDAPPAAGLLAVVNPDRVQSLEGCLRFDSQALIVRPCYGYGNFINDADENVYFFFVGTDNSLCLNFSNHFRETYAATTVIGGLASGG